MPRSSAPIRSAGGRAAPSNTDGGSVRGSRAHRRSLDLRNWRRRRGLPQPPLSCRQRQTAPPTRRPRESRGRCRRSQRRRGHRQRGTPVRQLLRAGRIRRRTRARPTSGARSLVTSTHRPPRTFPHRRRDARRSTGPRRTPPRRIPSAGLTRTVRFHATTAPAEAPTSMRPRRRTAARPIAPIARRRRMRRSARLAPCRGPCLTTTRLPRALAAGFVLLRAIARGLAPSEARLRRLARHRSPRRPRVRRDHRLGRPEAANHARAAAMEAADSRPAGQSPAAVVVEVDASKASHRGERRGRRETTLRLSVLRVLRGEMLLAVEMLLALDRI